MDLTAGIGQACCSAMRSLSSLFRPSPAHPVPAPGETLLGACQAGNFMAALSFLNVGPPNKPGCQEDLDRALGTLLLHAHVRGAEWGNSEADRWKVIIRLKNVGASLPQAFSSMPGPLRRVSAAQWNTLLEWGAPLDGVHAWKMWGAWVDDPILSDSPPPSGDLRMNVSEALSAVRNMVARGLRADARDAEGRTPLHVLCATVRLRTPDRQKAFLAWVDLVASAGSPLDALDHDGNTVVHALCDSPSAPLVPETLLTRFAQAYPDLVVMRNRFGQSPLDVLRATHRQHRRAGPSEPWLTRARWLQNLEENHRLISALPPSVETSPTLRRL